EVAQGHAGGGDDGHQQSPAHSAVRHGQHEPVEGEQGPDLGDGGHECAGAGGGALYGVGDPEVHGDGAGLEQQPGKHAHEAGGGGGGRGVRQPSGQVGIGGGAGQPVQHRDAEQQQDAGEHAKQVDLQGAFGAGPVASPAG